MNAGKNIPVSAMYQAFASYAKSQGFAKTAPARRTLRDRQTVTVATDVGSPSQPLKKSFYTSLSQPNRAIRSQDPKILDGSGIPKDVLIGIFGLNLKFLHAQYGTLTQAKEVIEALGDSVLEVKIGSDVLVELTGDECLVGSPGFQNTTDTATATATARTSIDSLSERFLLEWPRVVTDQATISADLYINKTSWTTNVDFNVYFELETWVALQGSPVDGSARLPGI